MAVTHLTVGEAALDIDSIAAHVSLACGILDGLTGEPLTIAVMPSTTTELHRRFNCGLEPNSLQG